MIAAAPLFKSERSPDEAKRNPGCVSVCGWRKRNGSGIWKRSLSARVPKMNLVGTWIVKDTDKRALADLGDVVFEFQESGGLIYTIRGPAKDQIIKLRYKMEGSTLVTDQASAPRVERTAFSISEDGVLTLEFGGVRYQFTRQAAQ